MKKKSKVIILVVIAIVIVSVALIISIRDRRIPFSRLHAVLDYRAQDVGAILFVIYDVDYKRDAECVKNVKPRLVIGDKNLVKRHFDIIPEVHVEAGRGYLDKIFNVLPDVRGQEGPEHMISSLNDTGLVFFTKDGEIFLLELILRPGDPPDKGKAWLAKIPCNELAPIIMELLDKYGL